MTATALFGLVRSVEDLPRALDEISDLLALRRRRAAAMPELLLGLWIDRRWIDRTPSELSWREPNGEHRTAYIRETAGINGIWMLCWLEVPPGEPGLSRHALLASLAAAYGTAAAGSPPACVPVFPLHAATRDVWTEHRHLAAAYAGLVLLPVYQDANSGRLRAIATHLVNGKIGGCSDDGKRP